MFLRHLKCVDNREKGHITEHYPAMRAGSDGGVEIQEEEAKSSVG